MDVNVGSDVRSSRIDTGPGVRRLAIVVGLPLVDGVFITLVLAGVLDSLAGIALTGIVIFGGTAAAAVVLADCCGKAQPRLLAVAVLGAVIIPVAGIQAMLAPTLATWLDIALLERFAAIILVIIALDMLGLPIREYLPSPGPVVILALLVSLDPANGMVLAADYALLVNGAIAAGIGIAAVASWILVGERLRPILEPARIRVAGGLSLVTLAVALVTTLPPEIALIALGAGVLFAIDRDGLEGTPYEVHPG